MTLILSSTVPKAEKELCFIMFTVFFHDFLPIACFRNLCCLFQLSFCAHLCCTFLDDLSISCRRIHISNCPTPKQLPYFIRIVSEYSPNWSGLPHCLPISFAFLTSIHLAYDKVLSRTQIFIRVFLPLVDFPSQQKIREKKKQWNLKCNICICINLGLLFFKLSRWEHIFKEIVKSKFCSKWNLDFIFIHG